MPSVGTARELPARRCRTDGFSLLELLIAFAVVAVLAAVALPLYRDYTATARDSALLNQINSMAVFQEDTRLRTGAYGAGEYDRGRGITTLTTAIGWEPSTDDGRVFAVTADGGDIWTVIATDAAGRRLCRVYPAGEECPVR